MKNLIGVAFLLLILIGCKNKESNQEYDSSANSNTSYSINGSNNEEKTDPIEKKVNDINKSEIKKPEESSPSSTISGNYIKLGEETDVNCDCYCLNINYANNSEFCLVKDKMYINVKFEKNQDGTTIVYYVNPSNKNVEGKDIPWDKFDRNIPIAKIENTENNQLKLDWLGFSIDGKLAVDYAIYGKKTLEGNYKIK